MRRRREAESSPEREVRSPNFSRLGDVDRGTGETREEISRDRARRDKSRLELTQRNLFEIEECQRSVSEVRSRVDILELTDKNCYGLQKLTLGSDLVVWLSEESVGELEDFSRLFWYPLEKMSWRVERIEGSSTDGYGSFLNCVWVVIACKGGREGV